MNVCLSVANNVIHTFSRNNKISHDRFSRVKLLFREQEEHVNILR